MTIKKIVQIIPSTHLYQKINVAFAVLLVNLCFTRIKSTIVEASYIKCIIQCVQNISNIFCLVGVINVAGKLWKDQRRFLYDGLRHFGMSYLGSRKTQMESRIMKEVEEFLTVLQNRKQDSVDLNPMFAISVSNVICDVLMSVRFSHNDGRFITFMNLIEEGFKLFGSLEFALFIPFLKYLPGHTSTLEKIAKVNIKI